MVVVWTLGGRQALGLPWENSFATLVALIPASAHCHWPRSKDQAPELCFLGAPPSQRVCGPRYGAGVAEKGRPGQSKTQEQPSKEPWEPACQQLLTPQVGLPNLPLPILRGGRCPPWAWVTTATPCQHANRRVWKVAGQEWLLLSEPYCGPLTHRPEGQGSRAQGPRRSKQQGGESGAAGLKTAKKNPASPRQLAPSSSPNFCHPPPRPKESFGKGRPHLVSWRASPAGALP